MDASQRRWSELTRLPTVLASSTGSHWRGFEFQEIEVEPEGSFDFSSKIIVLSLSCGPIKVRHGGARAPFLDLEPYPQLYLPGDYKVGAWRGVHRGFHLFVELEAVERMTHQPFRRGVFLRPSEHHPPIEHLLRALHFDVSAGLPSGPALGEAIVASMIDQITVPRPSSPSPKTCQLSLHELDHLRERIEASLDQPLTLDQLATEIGVSVRHLCRVFRATTGCTPHQYIVHRRVTRAMELIKERRFPLATVAALVGFSHQSHMTAALKRHLGVTPLQIRNSQR